MTQDVCSSDRMLRVSRGAIWRILVPSVFALVATTNTALAQTDTDDAAVGNEAVVVTAQRRAERSVDVPITVSTLTQDQLTTANVNQLSDTARITPALRFDNQGASMQPTIRGVGTAVTTSGGGPNVGIYVDGFFQANSYTSDFQLMNVENIQVLKGPQGTLFGRNTTGGAILVTTADPSFTPTASMSASYGSYNAVKLQGYASGGLSDNVAMDIEALYRSGDGYQTNVLNGDDTIGAYENWSVRTGLQIDLSDSVSALFRYIHSETDDPTSLMVNAFVDDGGTDFFQFVSPAGQAVYGASSSAGLPLVYFYAPAGTYATEPGQVTMNDRVSFTTTSDVIQATLEFDLGFADLTSYTQYREDDAPDYADLDATALQFFNIFIGVDDESVSQEFLLSSKPGLRWQWTAGLNYFQVRDTWDIGASFGGGAFLPFGGSSTTTKSWAAFVDATYSITDNLFLTLGGRYSDDTVTDAYFETNFTTAFYEGPDGSIVPVNSVDPTSPIYVAPGSRIAVADLNNDSFTPRVVLRYEPTDYSSVYASFTQGYKAGILNVGGQSQKPVEPEEIDAYEVGYKYDSGVLAFDFAGFFYDYQNLQVSSYQNGAAQIRNAASSEIYGLEGQFRYQATDSLSVYGGGAWTHAEYKSFDNAPYYSYCDPTVAFDPQDPLDPLDPLALQAIACVPMALGGFGPGALTQVLTDASGFEMQRSPEFTANLGASYDAEVARGMMTLSGNLYYSSSFFFGLAEQFEQDAYTLLSLRAQWTDPSDRFTFAVFGDNVTDEEYRSQVLFNTLGTGSVWAAPATYGVSVSADF